MLLDIEWQEDIYMSDRNFVFIDLFFFSETTKKSVKIPVFVYSSFNDDVCLDLYTCWIYEGIKTGAKPLLVDFSPNYLITILRNNSEREPRRVVALACTNLCHYSMEYLIVNH